LPSGSDSTETNLDHDRAEPRPVPYLFVVLEGGRPLAGGARLALDELDTVAINRGERRELSRDERKATLTLPDRRMSSTHAVIKRADRGWELVDAGSKNGCRLDGVVTKQAALRDGAWIEVGQTVLRFRMAMAPAEPWLDAETAAPVLDLMTLVPSLADQLAELAQLAPSSVPIVITGETGTGKELLARALHAASNRKGPFVAVNCAALSAGLVESQLFGHKRGAFSGAVADHDGFVRAADGGTLLLDEVGDLPLPAQAALLRVVQEREVVPVGDTRGVPIDVRFVAATHHDLQERIAEGALREDLYARLAGYVATLPPLSARREDLGTIVAAVLRRHARDRAEHVRLTGAAALRIATAPWPHNARELDKAIEVALALTPGDATIEVEHLPEEAPESTDDAATRARLEALLEEHRGNVSRVAREMGKARMQIQRWLKRFHLDPATYRR
jgi:transcriptional regulator with PAS, ATPase and Fis domain